MFQFRAEIFWCALLTLCMEFATPYIFLSSRSELLLRPSRPIIFVFLSLSLSVSASVCLSLCLSLSFSLSLSPSLCLCLSLSVSCLPLFAVASSILLPPYYLCPPPSLSVSLRLAGSACLSLCVSAACLSVCVSVFVFFVFIN